MRCLHCGWVVQTDGCPCGASKAPAAGRTIPVGTPVLARPGRGPSMIQWFAGEVIGHQGRLHKVETPMGAYWCEPDDLLAGAAEREAILDRGTRVWARWLDGRWYPGTVDGSQGPLRHVTWDDGDAMWLEASHIVLLAGEPSEPAVGGVVVARRWDGEFQPGTLDQREGDRFHVVFRDGEEAWVTSEDLYLFPPNPFVD